MSYTARFTITGHYEYKWPNKCNKENLYKTIGVQSNSIYYIINFTNIDNNNLSRSKKLKKTILRINAIIWLINKLRQKRETQAGSGHYSVIVKMII